jgi:hypothetical protein
MIFALDGEGDPDPVVEQQTLARCLTRLATKLHGQSEADPVLVMETALAAIALTRTWLESEVILEALAAVPRDQLEWWGHELAEDGAYVAGLRDAVQAEMGLSLRDRNRHGGRAETGGSIPVEMGRKENGRDVGHTA